jgi:methyl-accepting chemotaxis protein
MPFGARFHSIRSRVILLTALSMVGLLVLALLSLVQQQHGNAALRTVYVEGVLSISQLKHVGDAYALGVMGTVYKVRDGELSGGAGQQRIRQARALADIQWQAFLSGDISARERASLEAALPLAQPRRGRGATSP